MAIDTSIYQNSAQPASPVGQMQQMAGQNPLQMLLMHLFGGGSGDQPLSLQQFLSLFAGGQPGQTGNFTPTISNPQTPTNPLLSGLMRRKSTPSAGAGFTGSNSTPATAVTGTMVNPQGS